MAAAFRQAPTGESNLMNYRIRLSRRLAALLLLIAATALVHGLTVVTRDAAAFARMGVQLLNPWLAPSP